MGTARVFLAPLTVAEEKVLEVVSNFKNGFAAKARSLMPVMSSFLVPAHL